MGGDGLSLRSVAVDIESHTSSSLRARLLSRERYSSRRLLAYHVAEKMNAPASAARLHLSRAASRGKTRKNSPGGCTCASTTDGIRSLSPAPIKNKSTRSSDICCPSDWLPHSVLSVLTVLASYTTNVKVYWRSLDGFYASKQLTIESVVSYNRFKLLWFELLNLS